MPERQGQSLATIDKERRIGAALSIGMRIASRAFGGKGFRFWHLDANSGSGWNDMVNVPGSPLVFWQVARTCLAGMEPAPFFCDIDLAAMQELRRRLADDRDKLILLPGDNQEAIEVFAELIRRSERPRFAVGSLLIDPNGYFYRDRFGKGAPVEAAKWFSREFPRIDLILNLNTFTYQAQNGVGHAVEPPREVLRSLGKAHWLVGRRQVGSGHRFLLAVGRNTPTADHRALGMYRLESPEGQFIMNQAEGKRQHDLPELSRISAAPGVSRGTRRGDEARGGTLPGLRGDCNGSASHQIPALGNVRRPVQPEAPLSQLPLFGGGEG